MVKNGIYIDSWANAQYGKEWDIYWRLDKCEYDKHLIDIESWANAEYGKEWDRYWIVTKPNNCLILFQIYFKSQLLAVSPAKVTNNKLQYHHSHVEFHAAKTLCYNLHTNLKFYKHYGWLFYHCFTDTLFRFNQTGGMGEGVMPISANRKKRHGYSDLFRSRIFAKVFSNTGYRCIKLILFNNSHNTVYIYCIDNRRMVCGKVIDCIYLHQ